MALFHSPRIVTDNLVLCLDAGNPKSYPGSGATWYDLSGRANHATLLNTPTHNGSDLLFNGSNQHARIPINSDFQMGADGELTAMCWVSFESASSYKGIIHGSAGGGAKGWGLLLNSNESLRVEVMGGDEARHIYTPAFDFNTTDWFQLSAVFKQTVIRTFKNGAYLGQPSSWTDPGSITNGASYVYIGSHTGTSWFIHGRLALILVYNRTLTDNEVLQNHDAIKGRFGL